MKPWTSLELVNITYKNKRIKGSQFANRHTASVGSDSYTEAEVLKQIVEFTFEEYGAHIKKPMWAMLFNNPWVKAAWEHTCSAKLRAVYRKRGKTAATEKTS